MSDKTHSILIAEDQDIARLGLRLTLEKMSGMEVVGEAADGESAIKQTQQLRPDIVLMDIDLPKVSGIEATRQIKRTDPSIGIIMFTSDSSDETVFAAIGAGADGYCLKKISADQLRTAIDSVAKGAAWLDPGIAHRVLQAQVEARARAEKKEFKSGPSSSQNKLLDDHQIEVLQLIGKGMTIDQIAQQTKMPQVVVESQLRTILGNVGLVSSQIVGSSVRRPSGNRPPAIPGIILSDRFIIEEKIGAGGVSTVYRGKDLSIGRTVAIKMLNRQDLDEELEVKRFLQEAKAASAVSHPNVITIFDFGVTADKRPYIVMDYIDGTSIEKPIFEQTFSLSRTLNIFIQVCDALTAAHKKGIIHRDLKPSNIMVVKTDDGTDLIKLVDFGMAKFVIESEDLKLTKTGELCGTPTYMSPEHFQGRKLDIRTDIYSFGCVLYEALTGNPPFDGKTVFDMLNCHLNEKPSRLPFLRPGKEIPEKLETILFKTLEKEPDDRPQIVAEVKTILSEVLLSL